jgi:hypothetical protein
MPQHYRDALEAKKRGEWISNWDCFLGAQDYMQSIRKAKSMKTHTGRMKKLQSIIQGSNHA